MAWELQKTLAWEKWERIGVGHHHGVNTPLFSLRSRDSAGIGEFLDLKMLIDWLAPIGFDVIQLLPLNASGHDPSPYNSISAHALNPIYLSLHALPGIELLPELLEELERLKALSGTERVEYTQVKLGKDRFLRLYFEKVFSAYEKDHDYHEFLLMNSWVEIYARFRALKEHYRGKHWRDWPQDTDLSLLQREINCHSFIQYLAFQQMSAVKAYAESKGMFIKGDVPILVSPDSADVWHEPNLFNLTLSAGAPPDMYNHEGQCWGFPLYDYKGLVQQDFQFWKDRLRTAESIYHIYRVDHIVGLFRIWGIPDGKMAKEGFFIPENPVEWHPQGETMLKLLLGNSTMLPIGEDLGTIPDDTRQTMHALGIPGTKVIRWERKWHEDSSFIPYNEYPADSLTSVSTHDSEPLKLWWAACPEEAKAFAQFKNWPYQAELTADRQAEILRDSHLTSSLFHINLLQEYISLFPELTGGDLTQERINVPGTVLPTNWTYRYKPALEELVAHQGLTKKMRELIA